MRVGRLANFSDDMKLNSGGSQLALVELVASAKGQQQGLLVGPLLAAQLCSRLEARGH